MANPSNEQRELAAAEELIDRVSAQIRDLEPDPKVVEQASQRVWQQLSRRGMKLVKEGDVVAPAPSPVVRLADRRPSRAAGRWPGWAIAATTVAALGAAWLVGRTMWPAGPMATVQTVDTQLFHVATSAHLPLQNGAAVQEGETLRTGRDGGATLRLTDGSEIEMSPRAELSLDESGRGTTIQLERGSVIVHAAKQRDGHLFVATKDCLVSVTGTIFSVNHGTKGSRVSVIEGEVHVDRAGTEDVLHPGDQVTTAALVKVPVEKEIAWSRDVQKYVQLLAEAHALEREIAQRVPHADLRYDSRLLDLMPADTVLYGALPNVPEMLGQMNQVVQERVQSSPVLAEWWAQQDGEVRRRFEEALALFGELGAQLGTEVAVGIHLQGDEPGVAVIAEVRDAAGLQGLIERHLAELPSEAHDHVRLIASPGEAQGEGRALYIWLAGDVAVAATDAGHLRDIARFVGGEQNPFIGSEFYQSIAALYEEGAEFLIAANLDGVVQLVRDHDTGTAEVEREEVFSRVGLDNARHLLMEQKKVGDQTHHRGVLTFEDQRQGILAWLAAPAPMGSLKFVSPDAKLVAAAVLKDPAKLFDEIAAMSESGLPAALGEFERRYGLSVREDFMATIGGEIALALDGPLVPQPAFKLVLEVYDPARFQWALEQAVAEVNRQLAEGKGAGDAPATPITIERREKAGRTYFTIPTSVMALHYTFAEGYLVMAPDPALLDQALRYRSAGYSITDAPKFRALLPPDGRTNLSAVIYQDLASVIGPLAESFSSQLTPQAKAELQVWQAEAKPSLGYAYGEDDRLIFASSSHGDVLSDALLTMMGFKSPTGLQDLLSFGRFFQEATSGGALPFPGLPAPAGAEAKATPTPVPSAGTT